MKKTHEERREAIETFMPLIEVPRLIVRRTALEQVSTCPAMHALIRSKKCVDRSELTEVGEAVHSAIAMAMLTYVESEHAMGRSDLLEEVQINLRSTRVDIQKKAVAAAERALFSWADYVSRLPQRTIIAFDGGDRTMHPDDKSRSRTGQLSWEVSGAGSADYIVTAELDLLHSTRSPEVLTEVDYKSGWKGWDYESIYDSFQFPFHAYLVFMNYPSVNYLDVRIWSTRSNRLTPPLRFERRDMESITSRVRMAVGMFDMYGESESAPAWPYPEKCSICPCALHCPESHAEFSHWENGPEGALRRYVVLQEALKHQKEALKQYVTLTEKDIVTDEGIAFGREKPSTERWPTDPVYTTKPKEKKASGRSRASSKRK